MNKQDTSAAKASTSRPAPEDIDGKQHIVVRRTANSSDAISNERVVYWDQTKLNLFMHVERTIYNDPLFKHLSVFPGGYVYIETTSSATA